MFAIINIMSNRELPKNKPCPHCYGLGELPKDCALTSIEDIKYVCRNCGSTFGYDE